MQPRILNCWNVINRVTEWCKKLSEAFTLQLLLKTKIQAIIADPLIVTVCPSVLVMLQERTLFFTKGIMANENKWICVGARLHWIPSSNDGAYCTHKQKSKPYGQPENRIHMSNQDIEMDLKIRANVWISAVYVSWDHFKHWLCVGLSLCLCQTCMNLLTVNWLTTSVGK